MSLPDSKPKPRRQKEEGYVLVGLIFLVALLLVALAVAAPKMAVEIQRDKEEELIHRGNQYVRAIKLYYKKFGRYPSNISQLENSNNIRFLRKKYKDPFTGKDEWRIIHLGEAKVPTMGLFGLPASSGMTSASSLSSSSTSSTLGSSSTLSSTSSFLSSTTANSTTGATGDTSSGAVSSTGSTTDTSSSTSGLSSSTGSTGSTGSTTNSTLGGGLIVGVSSTLKRTSLKEYKKQKHYNEWEFVYDPVAEQLQAAGIRTGTGSSSSSSSSTSTSTSTTTTTQQTSQ